ncbi:hypothetical protein JCM3775_003911 [Rhodotorula graminis]
MSDLHARAAADLASGPIEAAPRPNGAAPARRPSATVAAPAPSVPGALPMRIPAILRLQGPKLAPQLAHKKERHEGAAAGSRKAGVAPGGKRRRRRWENAQLAHNPHLHRPSRSDFNPGPSLKNLSTTFSPPPATFSRSTYVSSSPSDAPSAADLAAASTHGHFSMSLRGLRRTLRANLGARRGGRSDEVLELMERELCAWLTLSGRIPEGFFHESGAGAGASLAQACAGGKALDSTPLEDWVSPLAAHDGSSLPDLPASGSSPSSAALEPAPPTLTELSRQPHALVWLAPSPHHRFLLHALARYYSLTSFSRPLSPLEPTIRVTHVLRPQIARAARDAPGVAGGAGAETPPGTDWTSAGGTEEEIGLSTELDELTSDADGELDTDTDAMSVLSAPLEEDEDALSGSDWEGRARDGVPAPAGAGGTDDEAEAVYSSATESSAEDTGVDTGDEAQRDALARRFARLGVQAPLTPTRLASPLARLNGSSPSPGGSATPRAPAPAPPFSPVPGPSSSAADPSTPLARPADRPRGRRSLPSATLAHAEGYSSAAESSPSRSPSRQGLGLSARGAFVGAEAGEWRLPERTFAAWVFE